MTCSCTHLSRAAEEHRRDLIEAFMEQVGGEYRLEVLEIIEADREWCRRVAEEIEAREIARKAAEAILHPAPVATEAMIRALGERNDAIEAALRAPKATPELIADLLEKDDAWEHECAAVRRAQEEIVS
jgi:hypothetical protein